MALATETANYAGYSPTSTPVLDVVRPAPHGRSGRLTSGEYFFLSSLLILSLIGLPALRGALAEAGSPSGANWNFALSPVLAFISAYLVHEVGHLIFALAAGFRASVGEPFGNQGQQHLLGSWVLRFARLEPKRTDHLRRRLFAMCAGGPLAGLVVAITLEMSRNWSQTSSLTQFRVHLVSAFSLLVSLAALLPDISRGGNFSDGARLIMLLKNDERAQRLLAIIHLQRGLQKGVHPREWDEDLITRAASLDDDSRDAVAAYWLAYLRASERQDIMSATRYLEEALTAPAPCSAGLLDRLFVEAAIFQAWFRDNPAKARSWAELIDRRRLPELEQQRLQIAMIWAEGKLFDAFENLCAYLRALEQIPASPSRELAQTSALEWKRQIESRMLTRAWRAMYTMTQQVESAASGKNVAAENAQFSSC
jgi:hypothetical protein